MCRTVINSHGKRRRHLDHRQTEGPDRLGSDIFTKPSKPATVLTMNASPSGPNRPFLSASMPPHKRQLQPFPPIYRPANAPSVLSSLWQSHQNIVENPPAPRARPNRRYSVSSAHIWLPKQPNGGNGKRLRGLGVGTAVGAARGG